METKHITDLNARLVVTEGTSKAGKRYKLTKLMVNTELYGDVEILLDTHHDRAGIILDMLARHLT